MVWGGLELCSRWWYKVLRVDGHRVMRLYEVKTVRGTLQARIHVLTQDESTELNTEIQKDFGRRIRLRKI